MTVPDYLQHPSVSQYTTCKCDDVSYKKLMTESGDI